MIGLLSILKTRRGRQRLAGLVCLLSALLPVALDAQTTVTPPPWSTAANSPNSVTTSEDPELEGMEAPSGGGTLILSDEFHYEEASGLGDYTGHVYIVGTNMRMRCESMTVTYGKDHKIKHVQGRGHVLIEQPGQLAHAGVADFSQEDDKIVLTESPDVQDGRNKVFAPKIIIFRGKKAMFTEGRTHTVLIGSVTTISSPNPTPTPITDQDRIRVPKLELPETNSTNVPSP